MSNSVNYIDCIKAATVNKSPFEAVCVAKIIESLWSYEERGGIEDVENAGLYLRQLYAELVDKSNRYQIVATPNGSAIKTPWNTLMIPKDGDMFNSKDEARETLLKTLLEKKGYCPCQPQGGEDTICPCKNYREEGKCICGLFVKLPQAMPKEEIQDAEIKSKRTDSDTEDGSSE